MTEHETYQHPHATTYTAFRVVAQRAAKGRGSPFARSVVARAHQRPLGSYFTTSVHPCGCQFTRAVQPLGVSGVCRLRAHGTSRARCARYATSLRFALRGFVPLRVGHVHDLGGARRPCHVAPRPASSSSPMVRTRQCSSSAPRSTPPGRRSARCRARRTSYRHRRRTIASSTATTSIPSGCAATTVTAVGGATLLLGGAAVVTGLLMGRASVRTDKALDLATEARAKGEPLPSRAPTWTGPSASKPPPAYAQLVDVRF